MKSTVISLNVFYYAYKIKDMPVYERRIVIHNINGEVSGEMEVKKDGVVLKKATIGKKISGKNKMPASKKQKGTAVSSFQRFIDSVVKSVSHSPVAKGVKGVGKGALDVGKGVVSGVVKGVSEVGKGVSKGIHDTKKGFTPKATKKVAAKPAATKPKTTKPAAAKPKAKKH